MESGSSALHGAMDSRALTLPRGWGWAAHLRACLPPDQVACADAEICQKVCGNPSGCSDIAYPKLVLELLPTGNAPPHPARKALAGSAWREGHKGGGGR